MIRLARTDDLSKLASVERSAASLFRDVGLDQIADGEPMDPAVLAGLCLNGTLWVADDAVEGPVGFLAAHELDGCFFIAEVSVARSHQRRGFGTGLIGAAVNHARGSGYGAVTLTTDRRIPWNGPYYTRLGFTEVDLGDALAGHRAKLQAEAAMGLDPATRCVMELRLTPPSGA